MNAAASADHDAGADENYEENARAAAHDDDEDNARRYMEARMLVLVSVYDDVDMANALLSSSAAASSTDATDYFVDEPDPEPEP
jgi:hypothetical protein